MAEPDTTHPKYATFNVRMLATAIEIGLLLILIVPSVNWIVNQLFVPINPSDMLPIINNWKEQRDMQQLSSNLWGYVKDHSILQRMLTDNILQIMLVAAYVLPFWFKYSTTPGKMIFRASIRDAKTGERMTRRQCVIRFLGYIVSGLPLTLGFVWILLNKKHRGFHDMIADTVVVIQPKKPKTENEQVNV